MIGITTLKGVSLRKANPFARNGDSSYSLKLSYATYPDGTGNGTNGDNNGGGESWKDEGGQYYGIHADGSRTIYFIAFDYTQQIMLEVYRCS